LLLSILDEGGLLARSTISPSFSAAAIGEYKGRTCRTLFMVLEQRLQIGDPQTATNLHYRNESLRFS
jgi:hypothetical protein